MEASEQIDSYIGALSRWQRETVTGLRELIHETLPGIVEEWKWQTPVFSLGRPVCAIGTFKDHVKINFFNGASLPDPAGLFNAGLEAKTSRAIDLREGEGLDREALRALLQAALPAGS